MFGGVGNNRKLGDEVASPLLPIRFPDQVLVQGLKVKASRNGEGPAPERFRHLLGQTQFPSFPIDATPGADHAVPPDARNEVGRRILGKHRPPPRLHLLEIFDPLDDGLARPTRLEGDVLQEDRGGALDRPVAAEEIFVGAFHARGAKRPGFFPRRLKLAQAEELEELRTDRLGRSSALDDDVADVAEEGHELGDALGQALRTFDQGIFRAAPRAVEERPVHVRQPVQ